MGFLQRPTLIGLILSVCFLVSAIQVTHFPTVKWCLTNPRELIQNSAVSRRRSFADFSHRACVSWRRFSSRAGELDGLLALPYSLS